MSESKASLVRQLKQKGVPVPKGATVADLKHRATHWKGGNGFLFRLAIPNRKGPNHPVALLEQGKVYWVPNSEFARVIAESNMVFIMDTTPEPPATAVFLDVPKDFKTDHQ